MVVVGLLPIAMFFWHLGRHLLVADPRPAIDFDQSRWISLHWNTRADPCVRYSMVPDLRRRHLRHGTPRREIEALLGQPEFRLDYGCFGYLVGQSCLQRLAGNMLEVCYSGEERLRRSREYVF